MEKLVTQFGKYKGHQNCAFTKTRGKLHFGSNTFGKNYDIKFEPDSGLELVNDNWSVQNWIDNDKNYDVCSAMQQVFTGKFITKSMTSLFKI